MAASQQQSSELGTPIYSQFGGDDDLKELVELYVDEMPGRIQALIDCYQAGDREELGRLAHQLKGASGSYGFMQISVIAAMLEQAARETTDNLDDIFEQTVNACRRAKAGTA